MSEPQLVKTKHGYYHFSPEPSEAELREYYANKYYQQGRGSYAVNYEPEEIAYFQLKASLIYKKAARLRNLSAPCRFIDVGCGEGWALDQFHQHGHAVLGLDFSRHAVEKFHPHLLPSFRQGDVYALLGEIVAAREQFGVLLLANVLEHVIDPVALLEQLRRIMAPEALLIILAPNDFSPLHEHLLREKFISRPFWVAYPDHLSYFNRAGMTNLLVDLGFKVEAVVGENPVDLNLLNENSNYIEDPSKGKKTHMFRVRADNFLASQGRDRLLDLYEILGDMGVGRDLVYYCSVAR